MLRVALIALDSVIDVEIEGVEDVMTGWSDSAV